MVSAASSFGVGERARERQLAARDGAAPRRASARGNAVSSAEKSSAGPVAAASSTAPLVRGCRPRRRSPRISRGRASRGRPPARIDAAQHRAGGEALIAPVRDREPAARLRDRRPCRRRAYRREIPATRSSPSGSRSARAPSSPPPSRWNATAPSAADAPRSRCGSSCSGALPCQPIAAPCGPASRPLKVTCRRATRHP